LRAAEPAATPSPPPPPPPPPPSQRAAAASPAKAFDLGDGASPGGADTSSSDGLASDGEEAGAASLGRGSPGGDAAVALPVGVLEGGSAPPSPLTTPGMPTVGDLLAAALRRG
jgi:hypothetical protein